MDKEIIAAIIGAAGVIVSALIGVFKKTSTSQADSNKIQQKVSGNGNTVIGTQVNNEHSEQIKKLQDTVEALREDIKQPEISYVELPNKAGGTTVVIGTAEEIIQAIEKELSEI